MQKSETTIWKNSRFIRFFASFTIGNIGDWFDIFALQIIFVHEWHASPFLVGVMMLLFFLPAIVMSPIAGGWADRVSRRNLMLVTDGIAAILTLGLYFNHSIVLALILLLVRSSVVSVNAPAQQAYVKQVVTDQQLLKASSYNSISFQMCRVLGPMLGAVVLIYLSARFCLLINAMSFLVSVLLLIGLPKDSVKGELEESSENRKWLANMKSGIHYIKKVRLIRATVIIAVIWFFFSMMRNAQMAIFLKHLLPQTPNALGLFMGFEGLGAVISGILLSRNSAIKRHHLCFMVGFLFIAVGIFGVVCYQGRWPHLLLYLFALIIGLGTGLLFVDYDYILKKETPKVLIGRVTGVASGLLNMAVALGTFSSGLFVILFGVREVYLGLSIIMVILALCAWFFIRPGDHQASTVGVYPDREDSL